MGKAFKIEKVWRKVVLKIGKLKSFRFKSFSTKKLVREKESFKAFEKLADVKLI